MIFMVRKKLSCVAIRLLYVAYGTIRSFRVSLNLNFNSFSHGNHPYLGRFHTHFALLRISPLFTKIGQKGSLVIVD